MSDSHFNGPLAILLRRMIVPGPPDPWPPEIDTAVRARDAVPLCIDCLHPQAPHQWFCPHCGNSTGDYVNWMEYLQIFTVGEVLRRGVMGPPENNLFRTAGFALLGALQYVVFVPLYWYWMACKAYGHPICHLRRKPLEFEEPT